MDKLAKAITSFRDLSFSSPPDVIDNPPNHHNDDDPNDPIEEPKVRRHRAIWISDIHLGTRGCKADALLSFLKYNDSDYLYLVGDIIDGWSLRRSWYWKQSHNDVVQKILRKARKGTQVIYVPGNHDEMLRPYTGLAFGEVAIEREYVHITADGRRFLIFHGDEFDGIMHYAKWLAHVGDIAYTLALSLNHWFNFVRRKFDLPYWSLSAYLKYKVKNAVEFISNYETLIAAEARRRGVDGVICGHIHHAEIRTIDGIVYANDGDWVESCTALVEDFSGAMQIVRWTDDDQPKARAPRREKVMS